MEIGQGDNLEVTTARGSEDMSTDDARDPSDPASAHRRCTDTAPWEYVQIRQAVRSEGA